MSNKESQLAEQTTPLANSEGMGVSLEDLVIGYPSHVVAGPISATLHEGELCCLLGANGAGKSTLLRTLAAFQAPLAGELWIGERQIKDIAPHELSTLIGIVLTDRIRTQGITVRDMVAMGRSPYTNFWGKLTEYDNQEVDKAMQLVGIAHFADRQIATLSDGERQKVMIAKALAQGTPIILLDEPTAFLDFPSKVDIMLLLGRLAHEMNKTIFLSTHDLDLALQTSDRLWLMAKKVKCEPMEQRGQSDVYINYAESRQRKTEGQELRVKNGPFAVGTPSELSDLLPSFFPSEHLEFDRETLRFRIKGTKNN